MAKLLVLNGASLQVKNLLGDTPISLAKRNGHTDLAMQLNQMAADLNSYSQQSPSKHERRGSQGPPLPGS